MPRRSGAASALAAALLFGSLPVLGKLADSPPITVALAMNLVAGLAFLPFLIRHPIPRRELPGVISIGVLGGALAPSLFLLGLERTTTVTAALLMTTETLFTMAIAYGLGERVSRRGYLAAAGLLGGAVIVATGLDASGLSLLPSVAGNLLILAAAVAWSADNTISRALSRRNAVPALVGAKCLVATAVLGPVAVAVGSPLAPSPSDLPLLLLLGVFVHAGAIWLFYLALRELGAMRTVALFTLSAVFGAVGGYLLFRDELTAIQVAAGAAMVALAVVLSLEAPARDVPKSENGPPGGKTLTKRPL